jgi:hypothetical protein
MFFILQINIRIKVKNNLRINCAKTALKSPPAAALFGSRILLSRDRETGIKKRMPQHPFFIITSEYRAKADPGLIVLFLYIIHGQIINLVLQITAGFELGNLAVFYHDRLACAWVPGLFGISFSELEGAKTADLGFTVFYHFPDYFIKDEADDVFYYIPGQITLIFAVNTLDDVVFCHFL